MRHTTDNKLLTLAAAVDWMNANELLKPLSYSAARYWFDTRGTQPVDRISHIDLYDPDDIAKLGKLILQHQQLRQSNKKPFPTRKSRVRTITIPI